MLQEYFEIEFIYSQDDVIKFAEASGDFNPIHLDIEYAKKSMFKKTIIHGYLGASIFSRVFGTIMPGNGTIYLKQNMIFLKPMFTNTYYISKFILKEKYIEKNRALFETIIEDKEGNITITGEALIQHGAIK